ncbi:unnamed protein product [Rotaria sp. Silwood1]|nr:unnamed protein product [Rotaria sp. Silwood1]CAF1532399.1 unnamed protein product [Rotaria sp. Silwood1]CAF3671552.1 unnamed protein product [Rotaria sp. Silwood1]
MVAKGLRDRRSTSSTTNTNSSTKRRISSNTHEKKKIVKPLGICSFCMGDEDKNANNVPEDMISCSECGNCGHPSCLKYSDKLIQKIKTIRWQCLDCKRCVVCNEADDSLIFCDYCDVAIHPKCCKPPLNHIPKGDFICHNCRHDETIKSSEKKSLMKKTSSTRSLRSHNSNEDDIPMIMSRPVAQLIDGMSNFFLPKKHKINNTQRQQSVQKAMNYLRNKTIKTSNRNVLKRLNTKLPSSTTTTKNENNKNQLIARSILASSKTSRIRRKPLNLSDDTSSNSQTDTNTPTMTRRSINKKVLTSETITPTPRISRRSATHPIIESTKTISPRLITKRKYSISPISHTPITIKKRTKNDLSIKKISSIRKETKIQEDEIEDNKNDQQNKSTVVKRKLNLDLSKYKTPPSFLHDSLPDTIIANDVYLFLDARKNSSKLISDCSDKFRHSTESIEEDDINNIRWPPYIVFGSELIKTWYSSSYPQEYARVPRLFICEFCLKYMKCEEVYDRHRNKCQTFHPPANEIYHKDDLSVFEVDGNINRIYCQNLCLLAKLFLDHKTLYYDVEPFLFYVLTKNDSNGCHFLGYFSKEKHCPQKYNLSCITVLPNRQRQGYGRFLIELSYLLSKKEGQIGTPERPLSTHGAQTYEAYWKIKIVQQLLKYYYKKKDKCILKDLMNEIGMTADDIIDTLQNLGILTMKSNEKLVIIVDVKQLETIMKNEKIKHAHWVSLDSEFVRFAPVLKPILFIHDENSMDNQLQEIQIVFKKIQSDPIESAENLIESADGSNQVNTTEVVRYVRRRKFGKKRRSIYVKYRVSNKNESNTIINEDEHSQEYIARRRDSAINESTKEDEDEEEEEVVEKEKEKEKTPPLSPTKLSIKQPTFKQLTLDQFLKKLPTNSSVIEKSKQETNIDINSEKNHNNQTDETKLELKNDNNEEISLVKRTKRLSNSSHISKSETDLAKITNGVSTEPVKKSNSNNQGSLTRQLSDGTASSNDSSTATLNSPLPFKKRAWTSANLDALIDPPSNPEKNEQSIVLSRETSLTTPSSVSDNSLMKSSSSINCIDEEMKVNLIEAELKTTMPMTKEVEIINDQPSNLTSMNVSQTNHFNYSTRSSIAKQQQSITINNFNSSTNMTYNYGQTSYPYPYPTAPTMDMQPFYYPSSMPMNYMPYYPTSSSPMYASGQQMCYQPNGTNSMPYTGNSTTPYNYSTSHSSSNRRH